MKMSGKDTDIIDETSLRYMTSEMNLLSQSDGSASFNQGDTQALVAVYGPAEVKMNREKIERATIDVLYKPKVGLPSCEDKLVEHVIRNVCESTVRASLHPRSLLSIIIQEMQDSGSFLACAINATCQALLDACYPMHFTIAAVACIYREDGDLIIDPKLKQEQKCIAQLTFVFDSKEKDIIACHTTGVFNSDEYKRALIACRQASEHIFEFYKDSMKKVLRNG